MQLCVGTWTCTGTAFGTCCGGACLDMQAHMHTQSPVGSPQQRALACMRSATEAGQFSSASCKLQEYKEKLSPGPQKTTLWFQSSDWLLPTFGCCVQERNNMLISVKGLGRSSKDGFCVSSWWDGHSQASACLDRKPGKDMISKDVI